MHIESNENEYLCIIFREHQEEIEAPFLLSLKDNYYYVKGYQNGLQLEIYIPLKIDCYFEKRQLPTD